MSRHPKRQCERALPIILAIPLGEIQRFTAWNGRVFWFFESRLRGTIAARREGEKRGKGDRNVNLGTTYEGRESCVVSTPAI
jgi:hypothetical protein